MFVVNSECNSVFRLHACEQKSKNPIFFVEFSVEYVNGGKCQKSDAFNALNLIEMNAA